MIEKTIESSLRNRFLVEWLHVPARDLWRSLVPGYLVQALGRLLRLDLLYFGALLSALKSLPLILVQRSELRRHDQLAFWYVMSRIERSLEEAMAETLARVPVLAGPGLDRGPEPGPCLDPRLEPGHLTTAALKGPERERNDDGFH